MDDKIIEDLKQVGGFLADCYKNKKFDAAKAQDVVPYVEDLIEHFFQSDKSKKIIAASVAILLNGAHLIEAISSPAAPALVPPPA